jgi:hypothetical protein
VTPAESASELAEAKKARVFRGQAGESLVNDCLVEIRKGACDASTVDLVLAALCDLLGQSRFFDRRWRNCLSSRNCICFLDQVLQHQFSNLVLDGDRGRKLESSAKPMRVHFILLVCLERVSFGLCSRIFRYAFGQPLAMSTGIIDVGCRTEETTPAQLYEGLNSTDRLGGQGCFRINR